MRESTIGLNIPNILKDCRYAAVLYSLRSAVFAETVGTHIHIRHLSFLVSVDYDADYDQVA
jgi:hypothetical protein